jgi:hypothetical protein
MVSEFIEAGMNRIKTAFFKYEISEMLDPENKADQPGDLREASRRVAFFICREKD